MSDRGHPEWLRDHADILDTIPALTLRVALEMEAIADQMRMAAVEIERLQATVAVADNLLGGTKWQKDYADVITGGDDA